MNYIAAFNFSKKRIPPNAKFDLLEEAVVQNTGLHEKKDGVMVALELQSVYTMLNTYQE